MFTCQHYKAIAEILADRFVDIADNAAGFAVRNNIDIIARKLADYFAVDNSRFNRQKFLEACGLK